MPSSKNALRYLLSLFGISNHPEPILESYHRVGCTYQNCRACTPTVPELASKPDPEKN